MWKIGTQWALAEVPSGHWLHGAGNSSLVLWADLEGWDGVGGGREVQEGGDTCIPVTDSR